MILKNSNPQWTGEKGEITQEILKSTFEYMDSDTLCLISAIPQIEV